MPASMRRPHWRSNLCAGLPAAMARFADATWILDHHEVHLLLQANPDGRKKAETGLSWRKNTNTNYCGPTSNNRGADLNRNFTYSWNSTGGTGSSGNECDITYRGIGPASEAEVQAIENYVRRCGRISAAPPLATPRRAPPAEYTSIFTAMRNWYCGHGERPPRPAATPRRYRHWAASLLTLTDIRHSSPSASMRPMALANQ